MLVNCYVLLKKCIVRKILLSFCFNNRMYYNSFKSVLSTYTLYNDNVSFFFFSTRKKRGRGNLVPASKRWWLCTGNSKSLLNIKICMYCYIRTLECWWYFNFVAFLILRHQYELRFLFAFLHFFLREGLPALLLLFSRYRSEKRFVKSKIYCNLKIKLYKSWIEKKSYFCMKKLKLWLVNSSV